MKPLYKATLWILLAFCAGTLLGGSSTYLYLQGFQDTVDQEVDNAPNRREGKSGPRRGERFFSWLNDRLKLDAEQQQQVRKILEDGRDRFRAIDQKTDSEFSKVREDTRRQIFQILRQDQVEEFNKMISEMRQKHSKKRKEPRN